MPEPSFSSLRRRRILSALMKLLVFIGFIFISIPFISSFSSASKDEQSALKTTWHWEIPLAELSPGKITKLNRSGKVAWIYARTVRDMENLKSSDDLLADAMSTQSEQPQGMKNKYRSADAQYFVFIPQENKRGCQVSLNLPGESMLFTEPCYAAKYDAAGRIFKNSGHEQQHNLVVPEHILENGILKINTWTPRIK